MPLDDPSERSIGTALAAILVAIAIFCLSVMALEKNSSTSPINDIFGILGLLSMLSSALIIDAMLDKANLDFCYRFKRLLNGGYFLFCIVMAGISFSILLIYQMQERQAFSFQWSKTYILFGASSIALFLKLMCDDKDHLSAPSLAILYFLLFYFAAE